MEYFTTNSHSERTQFSALTLLRSCSLDQEKILLSTKPLCSWAILSRAIDYTNCTHSFSFRLLCILKITDCGKSISSCWLPRHWGWVEKMCLFGQMEMWGAHREAPIKVYYHRKSMEGRRLAVKDGSLCEAQIVSWLQSLDWADARANTPIFKKLIRANRELGNCMSPF